MILCETKGMLFIPDISGFKRFVTETEINPKEIPGVVATWEMLLPFFELLPNPMSIPARDICRAICFDTPALGKDGFIPYR